MNSSETVWGDGTMTPKKIITQECTELFLRYREVARLVWNLGLWPNVKLREFDSIDVYREAMARLFEAMVVLALGYQGRIEHDDSPGEIANFRVSANQSNVRLQVDKNRPGDSSHVWGDPIVFINSQPEAYQLKFLRFFDWNELGLRDFRFLEVIIQRLNDRTDLVGRQALVEVADCSIWPVHNEKPEAGSPEMETVDES